MGEYYAVTFNDDHLSHHGIHGQKWGVRRFQNPDGTLTEAGKKRYRTTSSSADDINDPEGLKKREKDVRKSIRLNEKARGKEHSKIANNPENFLGLNKRHANKIDKYTKNIDAGKAEVERILSKKDPISTLASKTKTFVGDANKTFEFLARDVWQNLTNYGQYGTKNPDGSKKYKKAELEKTFRDAFGDDSNAQRAALKLIYSSGVTRYMDEESADPLSSDVYGRYSKQGRSKDWSRENRNHDIAVGNDWGKGNEDEWRGYMEDNVGHKIKPLSSDERLAALKESGYYDDDDLKYVKKLSK